MSIHFTIATLYICSNYLELVPMNTECNGQRQHFERDFFSCFSCETLIVDNIEMNFKWNNASNHIQKYLKYLNMQNILVNGVTDLNSTKGIPFLFSIFQRFFKSRKNGKNGFWSNNRECVSIEYV